MIIKIDGQDYTVPSEEEILLLQQFQQIMLAEYGKLEPGLRFLIKPAARAYLQKLENETRVKHGKEQALIFRPEKKQDAVVHLSGIMAKIMREALQHVTLTVGTIYHTVANFKLTIADKGTAGGQVALDGDERIRENNSS